MFCDLITDKKLESFIKTSHDLIFLWAHFTTCKWMIIFFGMIANSAPITRMEKNNAVYKTPTTYSSTVLPI
jgi:hypothetical protein